MRKLELKEIAAYLPYGLQAFLPDGKTILTIDGIANGMLIFTDGGEISDTYALIQSCKPILRPLSDLIKEIEHDGKKFIPQKTLVHLDLEWLITSENLIMKTNYEDVLQLLEWHFDVFNLIPDGLAFDINTLNKK